jgi:hypothetical protein
MFFQEVTRFPSVVAKLLILSVLPFLLNMPALARSQGGNPVIVQNINWIVQDDFIIISYEVTGNSGQEYEVALTFLDKEDPSFRVVPRAVTGAIGNVKFVDGKQVIRWQYTHDGVLPHSGEFFFEIVLRETGGFPWLWTGLGTAVVGGVAYLLLTKKTDEETLAREELPLPPPLR